MTVTTRPMKPNGQPSEPIIDGQLKMTDEADRQTKESEGQPDSEPIDRNGWLKANDPGGRPMKTIIIDQCVDDNGGEMTIDRQKVS